MLTALREKLRDTLGASRYRQLEMRVRRLRNPAFLGSLGRARPVSEMWGYDRGTPVDRYYIEAFLREQRALIRGDVLEMQDSGYTDQFGTAVQGHRSEPRKRALEVNNPGVAPADGGR